MASRHWHAANELLQATDDLCAEAPLNVHQLRELEDDLLRELADLGEDLARIDAVAEALMQMRERLGHRIQEERDV